jgi:hypothetical protein
MFVGDDDVVVMVDVDLLVEKEMKGRGEEQEN